MTETTARELLRRRHLRCTRPRCAVLSVLLAASHPLSHAEVTERLNERSMDRATVYRNLIVLSDASIVDRIDLGDHIWRFELAPGARDILHGGDDPRRQEPANDPPGPRRKAAAARPNGADADLADAADASAESAASHRHAHFLCTACGEVACLAELDLDVVAPGPGDRYAEVTDVVIRGICTSCHT